MGISKTLGIVSIVCGFLIPIVGLVCGIVGISVQKEVGHYNRDITLNVTGICISFVVWAITTLILIG